MTVKIIDIYSGNEQDNMEDIRNQGYSGIIFKAGQGGWADVPRYKPNWETEAREVGLLVGWYWLCDSRYSISNHMDELKRWMDISNLSLNNELGFWVDVEKPMISMSEKDYWKTTYAGLKHVVNFVYDLINLGINPGIYTGPGAFELISRGANNFDKEYLAQLKLWTAQYPYTYIPGVSKPSLYGNWTTWTLWQYQEGPDINIFNGTDEEFYNFFGSSPVEPPTGETMILTALSNGLRIRTGPGVAFAQVGTAPTTLNKGQTAEVFELSGTGSPEQWAKLGESRWANVWYNGYQNAKLEGTLPVEPPTGELPTITGTVNVNLKSDGYPDKSVSVDIGEWKPNA